MFISLQKFAVDRPNLKCDFIRYTPLSVNLVKKKENIHIFIVVPRKDSANSSKDCYFELNCNVIRRARVHARYAEGDQIRSANLGPEALYKE